MNYISIDTSGRKNDRVNSTTHKLNVDRRLMERNGIFNNSTTKTRQEFSTNKKNNIQYGNITNDKFEPLQYGGMPSRYWMKNDSVLMQKKENVNKYLDFNVYDGEIDDDCNTKSVNEYNNTYTNLHSETDYHTNINNLSHVLFNDIITRTNYKEKVFISPLNIYISLLTIGFDNHKQISDFFKFKEGYNLYKICSDIKNILDVSYCIHAKNILYVSNKNTIHLSSQIKDMLIIDKYNNDNIKNEIIRINTIISNINNRLINNVIYKIDNQTKLIYINTLILKTDWNFNCNKRDTCVNFLIVSRERKKQEC